MDFFEFYISAKNDSRIIFSIVKENEIVGTICTKSSRYQDKCAVDWHGFDNEIHNIPDIILTRVFNDKCRLYASVSNFSVVIEKGMISLKMT